MKIRVTAYVVVLFLVVGQAYAASDGFPVKPVELVLPYAAGGSTDLFARVCAKHASKYLPKPMVVVNREGGGGAVGVAYAANAAPDGYTVLTGVLTFLFMHKTVPGVKFTVNDFRGVSMLANDQLMFGVKAGGRADLPVPKFVELAKAKPDEILCGIGSNWGAFDLARIIFERSAGIKFRRVSFAGGAPTVKALLGGFVDVVPIFEGDMGSHVEAGTAKWLGVAGDERLEKWPDVPTFKEFGYDVVWQQPRFFLAPKATPDNVIKVLEQAFKKAFDDPEWKKEMKQSVSPLLKYRNSAELDEFLAKTLRSLDEPLAIMLEERKKASQ